MKNDPLLEEKVIVFDGEQLSCRRNVQGAMRKEEDAGLVCRTSLGDGRCDMYNQVIVIPVVGEFIYQGTLMIAIFDESGIIVPECWTPRTKVELF